MTNLSMISENDNSTVLTEYKGLNKTETFYQSEDALEKELIKTLVNQGFYNGVGFHRVIEGFMIQGGCPNGNGMGGPGYSIKGEFRGTGFTNNLKHEAGVLSMARTMAPNSAGSQFFIMHKNSPHLDAQYAAFGRVIEGMDVVNEIATTATDRADKPKTPQVMKNVTVETFGEDYSDVEKM